MDWHSPEVIMVLLQALRGGSLEGYSAQQRIRALGIGLLIAGPTATAGVYGAMATSGTVVGLPLFGAIAVGGIAAFGIFITRLAGHSFYELRQHLSLDERNKIGAMAKNVKSLPKVSKIKGLQQAIDKLTKLV
jgi:hypothetical protein